MSKIFEAGIIVGFPPTAALQTPGPCLSLFGTMDTWQVQGGWVKPATGFHGLSKHGDFTSTTSDFTSTTSDFTSTTSDLTSTTSDFTSTTSDFTSTNMDFDHQNGASCSPVVRVPVVVGPWQRLHKIQWIHLVIYDSYFWVPSGKLTKSY